MKRPSMLERYGSLSVDVINILIITLLLLNSSSSLVKFIAIFVPVVYFPFLHTLLSRSIGDIVFQLKIVDQEGNKISFRLAQDRFICVFKFSIISIIFSNLLFIFLALFTGTFKNITDAFFDYENESKTYLVKEI